MDFNRNFPFEWRPEAEQSGTGPYPASEPEIKAMMDFIVDHPNITAAMTYHTFGRVILRPYSTKPDDEMDTSDLWIYQKMTAMGAETTGYRGISTYHDFKYHPKEVTTGAFDDWLYDHLGIFAFTTELWDLPTQAGIENRKLIEWFRDHPHEDDQKILNWVRENCGDDAYVDWYAFGHPQLGQVELGGWNHMYTWRNPPPEFLVGEASRNLAFILSLAEMLPHLSIANLEVTALDDQTYHLRLLVENTGYLPTFTSQQGKKRKSVRPVRVDLTLPEEAEILSGKPRHELGHLEGRSNKFSLTFGTSPTDNRARYEWVVRAPKGEKVQLNVLSERAGVIRKSIEL